MAHLRVHRCQVRLVALGSPGQPARPNLSLNASSRPRVADTTSTWAVGPVFFDPVVCREAVLCAPRACSRPSQVRNRSAPVGISLRAQPLQDLRRRKVIGEGQFGKVLRCELSCDNDGEQQPWPSTAQTVAVKVFKNASTETHAYCGRELAMMAGCHHAHVTKVRPCMHPCHKQRDPGTVHAPRSSTRGSSTRPSILQVFGICIMEDECPGIVTEYLPGTLLSLLERHAKEASECVPAAPSSTVPYPIICKVGRQITETLHFLHAQKVCLLQRASHSPSQPAPFGLSCKRGHS